MIKKTILFLLVLFCTNALFSTESYLLMSGSGSKKISIAEKESKKEIWNHPLEKGQECNCVSMNANAEIIYSYKHGAKLVSLDHQVIWDYPTEVANEIQCAIALPDGGYLLGICGKPSKIVELDKKGKVRKEISFETNLEKAHSQFRNITKLKNGNYLVPFFGKSILSELDKEGKTVKTYQSEGTVFAALELENGNFLVSCGDAHQYMLISRATGEVIEKVKDKDIAGVNLLYVAQIVQLKNGNRLICNWDGHCKDKNVNEPQIIEIDTNKNIVWSLNDKLNFGKISSLKVIDNKKVIAEILKTTKLK